MQAADVAAVAESARLAPDGAARTAALATLSVMAQHYPELTLQHALEVGDNTACASLTKVLQAEARMVSSRSQPSHHPWLLLQPALTLIAMAPCMHLIEWLQLYQPMTAPPARSAQRLATLRRCCQR